MAMNGPTSRRDRLISVRYAAPAGRPCRRRRKCRNRHHEGESNRQGAPPRLAHNSIYRVGVLSLPIVNPLPAAVHVESSAVM